MQGKELFTWAVVAFGEDEGVAMMACGSEFATHLGRSDLSVGDVWTDGPGNRPGLGVWRWDGQIVPVRYDTDYGDEWDVAYQGEWTLVTSVESLTKSVRR